MEIVEATPIEAVDAWDQRVDVVVVGLGVAGACAALEAHAAGADVVILERASGGGGASATSEGIFYLGGGTKLQLDLGYADDAENMYAFMRASTSAPDDLLRTFCDGAAAHFAWLEEQGVRFERRAFTGKAVAVRTGEGLLMTGNEKVWPFVQQARPFPRGHQPAASAGEKSGAPAMRSLIAAVERDDIAIRYDTGVIGLVVDDAGRVRGVRVRDIVAGDGFIEARNGVILATGSFNLSDDLTRRNIPVVAEHGRPLGIPSNDGSGVLLGQTVGAATRAMDGVIATSSIYPPAELIHGIIVNTAGERFVAEDSYHGRTAYFIERQPQQRAWLIVDERHFAYPERGQPLVDVFPTVAEAEGALGLPDGALQTTLDTYNAGVAAGEDAQFHKDAAWLSPLEAPIAAFDLSFETGLYSYITLGGLATDADGRALADDDVPIDGLYAVGAVAAHLPQSGAEYASGMSLGPGSFFGRRAGRHAAGRHAVD
jgi:succinate dehydrogenase/fumarate reductase flavoprotein subunit